MLIESDSHHIKHGTDQKDAEIQSWKVMMEKELSVHQEEWQVMQRPRDDKKATTIGSSLDIN